MHKVLLLSACGLTFLLVGCSEQPQAAAKNDAVKKEEKTAPPLSGQSALYRMYQVARAWAPDAQVLKMNSMHLPEIDAERGKAGAWQATFTSAAQSAARSYTNSVAEEEGNLHKGVFPGQPESWSGPAEKSFLIAAVKTDTDAAYKTALEHAGDYDTKNPKQTISFLLEKQPKYPDPVWRVIWGESVGTSGLSVLIDATTGKYLETLH